MKTVQHVNHQDGINYGLIGFGGIAENRIAGEGFALDTKRFAPLAEAKLIGATDINPERRNAAENLGLTWYPDAAALLADPAIEAVVVATNNLSHAIIAAQALEAGRHVLVEKPMATLVSQAEKLVTLARTRKRSLAVDHMMVENSANRKARELVAAGALGTINDACFHMEFSFGSTPGEAASWRCANPAELGGPIGDVASHCLYMAEFMFDSNIVELGCVYYPKTMATKVEDGAYIKYRMANGMSGSVRAAFSEPRGGMAATLDNLGYEIFGADGVLRGHGVLFQLSGHDGEPVKPRLELDTFDHRADVATAAPVNIYQAIVRRHARSILDGKLMDGADGLQNLRIIAACHESAQNGGRLTRIDCSP